MGVLRVLQARVGRPVSPWWQAVMLGLAGSLAGCGGVEPVAPEAAPITDPTQLYMGLTLDYPAVTLSTDPSNPSYNTLQLTATPRDAQGNPMSGLPAPVYHSSDTASVTVTTDGLVTALQPTQGVNVIATLQVGAVTHADTAVVNVTNLTPPPTLTSLSIDPVAPDSAVWGIITEQHFLYFYFPGFTANVSVIPRSVDATGASMTDLVFEYMSLDPTVATIDRRSGVIQLLRPGNLRLVARTTAYGVTKVATTTFTITLPTNDVIDITPGPTGTPTFSTTEVRIRPYGLVGWRSFVGDTVDVVFDDATNVAMPPADGCDNLTFITDLGYWDPGTSCGIGNVVVTPHHDPDGDGIPGASVQVRQFPVPGVYPFHSTRLGVNGRIVVTTDPNGNPNSQP